MTDDARRALGIACARTLAGQAELAVVLDGIAAAAIRGNTDAIACRSRFQLPVAARGQRPGGSAGAIFDVLAEARAEALGARWLPGIASNLAGQAPGAPSSERLRAWTYAVLRRQAPPDCPPGVLGILSDLGEFLDQPDAYARAAQHASLALAGINTEASGQPGCDDAYSIPDNAKDSAASQVPGDQEDDDGTPEAGASPDDSAPGVSPPPLPDELSKDYRIYTTRHDRVVSAGDLASGDELARLRAHLDTELTAYRRLVARLAHRLQRRLLARQRRHWAQDQEAGLLDPSRLARLVADPSQSAIFREEQEGPFRQTAVTLLLDNSGSMRGHPITVAALTADILAHSLERCGIKVEILGYTTADWEGGTPAQTWERAGRPANPGRVNALRHIVYKAMDTPWRRARRSLGLMLKDGLLKENIDGEALWWAYQRLAVRPEPRRLLIVVSDGAPMDKATLAANPRHLLDRHLHQVVAWIEARGDVDIRAIGIGHPVARYYRKSVSLRNVDELGTVLMERLGEWLD